MHASHPHRPAPPLQPQLTPTPAFVCCICVLHTAPRTPADFYAACGDPLAAGIQLGLYRGLRFEIDPKLQSKSRRRAFFGDAGSAMREPSVWWCGTVVADAAVSAGCQEAQRVEFFRVSDLIDVPHHIHTAHGSRLTTTGTMVHHAATYAKPCNVAHMHEPRQKYP